MNRFAPIKRLLTTAAQTATKPTTARTERVKSICPEGTVLKGLNVLKDSKDPIALKDDAYPDWLWDLTPRKSTNFSAEDKLSLAYLRYESKATIKRNTLARKTK
jgi:large subunit ribosomal protein L54